MNRQVYMLTLVLLIWFDSRGGLVFFLKFLREELKMNEIKECKHKSPIYVVKRIRLLDYLVSKNLFPNAIQPDATNPHYKNWIYKNTPELEAALAAYEPFKRAQR